MILVQKPQRQLPRSPRHHLACLTWRTTQRSPSRRSQRYCSTNSLVNQSKACNTVHALLLPLVTRHFPGHSLIWVLL